MVIRTLSCWLLLVAVLFSAGMARAEQAGSIRGVAFDKDFDVPLAGVQVTIAETGQTVTATDQGNFSFGEVEPGNYTLVFSKEGYARQVESNVIVSSGQMAEVEASLSGEFVEMEEFVVQDLQIGGVTEAGLLRLRIVSPALLDSISAELISQAGAGDVASALKLVSGATVQEGKYAVIRGLPDRYVNSQMNAVRLPTADADKRAVELDQFPSALIKSVQVSKTFTPDQQGDASGGAVNVVLKGIPDGPVMDFKTGTSYHDQATGNNEFLTYENAGVHYFGNGTRDRHMPFSVQHAFEAVENAKFVGDPPAAGDYERYGLREEQINSFQPVMGCKTGGAEADHNWSLTMGNKYNPAGELFIGMLGTFYYSTKHTHYKDGINDKRIGDIDYNDFGYHGTDTGDRYELYDVTKSSESILTGGLVSLGAEIPDHKLSVTFMRTQSSQDSTMLMEDVRALQLGLNNAEALFRNVTLRYTERQTSTLQYHGEHDIRVPELSLGSFGALLKPQISWTYAHSEAGLWEPDLRGLVSQWTPDDPDNLDGNGTWRKINVAGGYTGRRVWRDINERSDQLQWDGKLRFTQWTGNEGFVKFGIFRDKLTRTYEQDSFSYLFGPGIAPFQTIDGTFHGSSFSELFAWDEATGYNGIDYDGDAIFLNEMPWQIVKSGEDADYEGVQEIKSHYWMVDLPVTSWLKLGGGVRTEKTIMKTEFEASDGENLYVFQWNAGQLQGNTYTEDEWSLADANLEQTDFLPAYSLELELFDMFKLRGSYTETIARPTFKEISPILQRDYIGSDQFVGNNNLGISELKNYDLRLDFYPVEGTFFSASYFYKNIKDPIEYATVAIAQSPYVQPFNFPYGWIEGYEVEARQDFGTLHRMLDGLQLRVNATFMDSAVTVPLELPETGQVLAGFPINGDNTAVISSERHMKGTPAYLLNASLTYDLTKFGTQFNLFYTRKGDTLIAGEGIVDGYSPNVYAKEHQDVTLGLSQKLGEDCTLSFRVKNLLNEEIETAYRSEYINREVIKESYRPGRTFSTSLSGKW